MKIAFQGIEGSYSHGAVVTHYPDATPVPQPSFGHSVRAVLNGEVDAALLPFENLLAGRVSGLHDLLGGMDKLFIHHEHYVTIDHCLVGLGDASEIKTVYSHPQALAQCRNYLDNHDMKPAAFSDTAAAAEFVAKQGDVTCGAISSSIAAGLFGLNVLAKGIANQDQNMTRFLLWTTQKPEPLSEETEAVTSLYFSLKHRVNALYEVLTIFAESGLNLLKIESYVAPGSFTDASFYLEVEANTAKPAHREALEKAAKLCHTFIDFGCYPKQRPE